MFRLKFLAQRKPAQQEQEDPYLYNVVGNPTALFSQPDHPVMEPEAMALLHTLWNAGGARGVLQGVSLSDGWKEAVWGLGGDPRAIRTNEDFLRFLRQKGVLGEL